jgi:anaerobic ribonucleoside-triphosphate reductase activating protein
MKLRVASVVPLTEAEGPGVRFALWVQGCTIKCSNCTNPAMFAATGPETEASAVVDQILAARKKDPRLEGISLLGGEPIEQDEPLSIIASVARDLGLTVMTYTGYEFENPLVQESPLLPVTDLLKSGPYVEALRTTKRRWIGSSNQRLHFLTNRYLSDDPRFSEPNTAEIRLNHLGELTVVGFPFESVVRAFPNRKAL